MRYFKLVTEAKHYKTVCITSWTECNFIWLYSF